jgi:hypothetical protein
MLPSASLTASASQRAEFSELNLHGLLPCCVRFAPTSHPVNGNTRYRPACSLWPCGTCTRWIPSRGFHRLIFGSSPSTLFPSAITTSIVSRVFCFFSPYFSALAHTPYVHAILRSSSALDSARNRQFSFLSNLLARPVSLHRSVLPSRGRDAGCPDAPRADPYGQHCCIRLLPQILSVEAHVGIGMLDLNTGDPADN